LKQSETKDQTRKCAKIKGHNYNFGKDLITKLQEIQWLNQKKPSGAVSPCHCLQQLVFFDN
jgi:hypothetical protein